MAGKNFTVSQASLDPNSKTYLLGLRLDRTWRAPGVRLMWTFHGQYFTGKPEGLIACGVAEADWFPADWSPTDWRQRKLTVDGRSITVQRKSKYGFEVYVKYSPEEKEQEKKRDHLAMMKERELDEEDRRVGRLPNTAEEFKSELIYVGTLIPEAVIRGMSYSDSGFRFDENTIVEMKRLNAEMEFCLQHGRVVFDPEVRASTVANLKVARARIDPSFQAVLARLKDSPTLPE